MYRLQYLCLFSYEWSHFVKYSHTIFSPPNGCSVSSCFLPTALCSNNERLVFSMEEVAQYYIYTHTHTHRNQWLTYMESTKFTAHVCKWLYHLDSGTISQFQGRIVFILIHLSCLVCKVNGPCNFFAMFKHITLSLRFYSA